MSQKTFSFFLFFLLLSLFVNIAFAAQSTKDTPVSVAEKQKVLKEIVGKATPDEEEYVIGCGDLLAVSIYDEGDMSVNASEGRVSAEGRALSSNAILVRSDGRISLKDIGDVEVVGLTFSQLADYLKQLYSTLYDDPVMVTSLIQSNSMRYTVMGEVNRPGTYRLDNTTNLVQVVAEAGGFTKWAGRKITVVRKKITKKDAELFKNNTITFDYDRFVSGKDIEKNISVRTGDIIVVK